MGELRSRLEEQARELGFHRLGVARAAPLGVEAERLRAWLSAGRHGVMGYMEETAEVRTDPTHQGMLPSARSVIVLATSYARAAQSWGPTPGKVARYARGRDYHNVLLKRARKLAQTLRAAGHTARVGVDSMPLFERAWAQRAGLGFIGKNCCLIVPGLGSHLFLTVIVTSAELPEDAPIKERCGECTRCLDACPTRAFVGSRELDARRCISYLTIEQRGAIEPELMERMGDWLFGCDVCQDVCPFNATSPPPAEQTVPFAPDERRGETSAADILRMSAADFAVFAEGSPMKRPGRDGLARNAAVVLGNSGEKRHLPLLREVARDHESALVRDTARWAATKLDR
ncbi:MAG: tRNA epoxyqueuosine(34) reductase QueG [Myxococcales bacterium]